MRKMTVPNDFAVFILTHGRADNVLTVGTLHRMNYSGKIYLIIDDQDDQADRYRENFKDDAQVEVIQFNKVESAKKTDLADNMKGLGTVVIARNESFQIAKDLGLRYFLMFEDDYVGVFYRYPLGDVLKAKLIEDFDDVCNAMLKFMQNTTATTICFAQAGDYIGGLDKYNHWGNKSRKVMNSFFCDVERPFKFLGRMNDDVSMYVTLGTRGHYFLTIREVAVNQTITQKSEGGLSDMYLKYGTYVKSFYSVLYNPSAVKINSMGWTHRRIHHRVEFNNCAPKVLSDDYKKSKEKITPICKEYIV